MREAGPVVSGQLAKITEEALRTCGCATPAEADRLIADVLALARQWFDGALPLVEVRRLTTPQERYLAARFVRPQPKELRALLDALVADNPAAPGGYAYATPYGTFTATDLREAQAKMDSVDGDLRIRFPQRQPWSRYPDDDGTTQADRDGERAQPFYPEDADERRRVTEEFATKRMGAGPKRRRTIARKRGESTDE